MLKTTLVIAGDTDQGVKALDQLDRGLGKVDNSARDVGQAINAAMQTALQAIVENTGATNQSIAALVAATGAARQRADAANAQASAERAAAQAANDNARAEGLLAQQAAALRAQIDPMYAAQQKFNQALDVAEELLGKGIIQQGEYARAVEVARGALQDHAKAVAGSGNSLDQASGKSKQAAAGYINLGRQMQDVAVMAAMPGVNLGTIITTQGGQIADAVSQMGGKFSGLASFLAGPWGAAIIVGTGLLVNFAEQMWKSGDAADKTKNAHETLADKLNLQKHSWEEVIAAMRDYNREAKKAEQSAYDQAAAAFVQARSNLNVALTERQKLAAMLDTNRQSAQGLQSQGQGGLASALGAMSIESEIAANEAKINTVKATILNTAGALAEEIGKINSNPRYAIEQRFKAAREQIKGTSDDVTAMAAKIAKLNQQEQAELDKLNKKRQRQPKDNSASLIKFDDDVAGRIAKIANQYAEMPTAVQKANSAMLDLDAIQRDILAKSKGKNGNLIDVTGLTAQIETVRGLIENGLDKPYRDYVEKASEQMSIDKLIVAGRQDEADALRVILGLQKQQKPLTEAQADNVVQLVTSARQYQMVLRDQHALIQANVSAATNMRSALNETVADTLKGRGSFDKILSSVGNSYVNIMSGRIVESIFGDSLRAFEDEATRNFRNATETAGKKVTDFGDIVAAASAKISGGSGPLSQADLASADPLVDFLNGAFAKAAANDNGVPVTIGNDIVVSGRRSKNSDIGGVASPLIGLTNSLFARLGVGIPDNILKGLKPLFSKLETALPDAVQGGLLGGAASHLINGSGSSSIGGTIGGAIGQEMGKKFLPAGLEAISKGLGSSLGSFAGPLGSIVGGVVGGMLGDLFATTKAGTTVITGANKASTTGSTESVSAGLTNMGNSITSTLESVASKFNTSVGDFAVSIGQYKDYFRVSASGSSHVGDKYYPNSAGADILYDGTDQATATLIAIQNAIADGAIKGLSKAVQKAMSSSTNIESALREALKVQDVELAIGGIGASMEKSFREAEQTASERVRIAQQYGFDLLAVDKVNAEARVTLQKKLLSDQVGSLQQIIEEMSSGALFEGSAVDQRAAILAKITTAKADVAAGKDGASDTLAKLLEQLNTVSKEAFGTTAQYQADRAMIADVARDAITAANQRISDAQAMVSQQAQTNQTLDEATDLLSRIASSTGLTADYIKSMMNSASNTNYSDLLKLAATS